MKCESCLQEVGKIKNEYVTQDIRLKVCNSCMNLLVNHEWVRLTEIAKKAREEKVSE